MLHFYDHPHKLFVISSSYKFKITDMSYRMKLVTGFYHMKFPVESTAVYRIIADKVFEETIIDPKDGALGIRLDGKIIFCFLDKKYRISNTVLLLQMIKEVLPNSFVCYIKNEKLVIENEKNFEFIGKPDNFSKATGIIPPRESFYGTRLQAPSHGYFHSTPVLYLTSNIGMTTYSYIDHKGINQKVLMRINNYFINEFPIVCNNTEFISTVPSGALCNVWFQLVDANFEPVTLQAPMYLSAIIIPIPNSLLAGNLSIPNIKEEPETTN